MGRRIRRIFRDTVDIAGNVVTGGALSQREQAKEEERRAREDAARQQALIDKQKREQEAEEQWQKEQAQVSGAIQGTQLGKGYMGGQDYNFANMLLDDEEIDDEDTLKKFMKKR